MIEEAIAIAIGHSLGKGKPDASRYRKNGPYILDNRRKTVHRCAGCALTHRPSQACVFLTMVSRPVQRMPKTLTAH